jgi:hypothetical protein
MSVGIQLYLGIVAATGMKKFTLTGRNTVRGISYIWRHVIRRKEVKLMQQSVIYSDNKSFVLLFQNAASKAMLFCMDVNRGPLLWTRTVCVYLTTLSVGKFISHWWYMNEWLLSTGAIILTVDSRILGYKHVPLPLCRPQITHEVALERTRFCAVGTWQLITRGMARPWTRTYCK